MMCLSSNFFDYFKMFNQAATHNDPAGIQEMKNLIAKSIQRRMNLKFGVLHFATNQPSIGPEDGWFGQPKYSAPNFEIILCVLTVLQPYMDYFTGSTVVSDPSL